MSQRIEVVVARLCVEKGWMSPAELAVWSKSQPEGTSLSGEIVSRGHLQADEVSRIRHEIGRLVEPIEDADRLRREDRRVVETLARHGLVPREKLDEALAAQEREVRAGKKPARVSELLLHDNALGIAALLEAMRESSQKLLLVCGRCRVRYSVSEADPNRKYTCRKCGGALERADEAATVRDHELRMTKGDPVEEDPEEIRQAAADPRKRVGKYVLLSELGRGGMGVVYKSWDSGLKRWVALKLLTTPGSREDVLRFHREAQTAAALRHPNIVGVYEVGEAAGHPFIALEYVEGKTLSGQKLPVRRAAEVVAQIARAVEYAHGQGVIHRDLKPGNVMIDKAGKAWVMDFGLAKNVRGESQLTMSGTVIGTPSYMPPEQASGRNRELDRRVDVYSLGAVLYELATGRAPFRGSSPLATLEQVVNQEVRPPSELNSAVPPDLETILLKCLEKDRHRRYPSVRLLADDLERWLQGDPIAARRASMVARLQRKLARNKSLAVAVGAILFSAGLVVGILYLDRRSKLGRRTNTPIKTDEAERRRHEEEKAARAAAQPHYDTGRRNLEDADKDLLRAGADLAKLRQILLLAVDEFSEAIRIVPTLHEAWLGRGQAYVLLSRHDDAEKNFTKAIEILPNYFAAYTARGRLFLSRFMELAESEIRSEQLPAEFLLWRDKAIADFKRAQGLGNLGEEVQFVKASLAQAEDRMDEAIALLTDLIDGGSKKEYYYKLRGDGWRKKALQNPARAQEWIRKAFEDYSQAILVGPNYYSARRFRGAIYFEFGQVEDAGRDFQEGLRINPESSFAHSDLATYYERTGKDPEAAQHFARAIELNPRNFRAWANRSVLKLRRKEFEEARKDLEQALTIHPQYLPARHNYAYTWYFLGDERKSLELFAALIQDQPKFAMAYHTRGRIHMQAKRWNEALADFRTAVQLDARQEAGLKALIEECEKKTRGQ